MNRRELLIGARSGLALAAASSFASLRAMGSADDYDAAMVRLRRVPASLPLSSDLLRYATLAPNGHNAQPWCFKVSPDHIDIEVPALRPELAALVGMTGHRPDIVMRFGYAADLPFSPRRPPRLVA
jgi:hypothetical protein